MDQFHKDNTNQKKPDAKEHIVQNSTYIKSKIRQNQFMLLIIRIEVILGGRADSNFCIWLLLFNITFMKFIVSVGDSD